MRQEGGLWDESRALYGPLGGQAREQRLDWRFPSGAKIAFSHLEYERDRFSWDGAQIPLIGFDQLEHFTERQFFYLLGRNRSTCGVRPYIRATCNPDPESWLADFVAWWIDAESGYAIAERSGRLRWFLRFDDSIVWADSDEALTAEHGMDRQPLSVTFIAASLQDNRILLARDPGYRAKLRALPKVERERLERGNWKIRPAAGLYFQRAFFEIVAAAPAGGRAVRVWDLAASEAGKGKDPDWTAGVRMRRAEDGSFLVEDVVRLRGSPLKVERALLNTATSDGSEVEIGIPQDPGQAGKAQAQRFVRLLAGYRVRLLRERGDKVTRAAPLSAQAEAGNVRLVKGRWNGAFLAELESFPDGHDDQVDAAAGAFALLVGGGRPRLRRL